MSRARGILVGISRPPLIILQWSTEQPALPILRLSIESTLDTDVAQTLILVTLLHPPKLLLPDGNRSQQGQRLKILDFTHRVPGYTLPVEDDSLQDQVLQSIRETAGPVTVVFDSIDTLVDDLDSLSQVYDFLKHIQHAIASRPAPSSLILSLEVSSRLLPHVEAPTFSPVLAQIIIHHCSLILHIFQAYLLSPPPISPPAKYWTVLTPLLERNESRRLVFGSQGEGASREEAVLQVVERLGGHAGHQKKGVTRVLEGWMPNGPCDLTGLPSLKTLFQKSIALETSDPAFETPFNLALTPSQRVSRSKVHLPFLHGQPSSLAKLKVSGVMNDSLDKPSRQATAGDIVYEPDSGDDLDDDDPDEDLDI